MPTEEENSLLYFRYASVLDDRADPVIDQLARSLRSGAVIRHAQAISPTPLTNMAERDDETLIWRSRLYYQPPPPMTARGVHHLLKRLNSQLSRLSVAETLMSVLLKWSLGLCCKLMLQITTQMAQVVAQMKSGIISKITAQMVQIVAQSESNLTTQITAQMMQIAAQAESRLMMQIAQTNVGHHSANVPVDQADQDFTDSDGNIESVDLRDPIDDHMSNEMDPKEYYTTPPIRIHNNDNFLEEGGVVEEVVSEVDSRPFKMRKCSVDNMESTTPVIDLTKEENEAEYGNRFHDIGILGSELEARISRLEREIRKLKRDSH